MFGLKDASLYAEERPDGTTVAYPAEKYGIKVASIGFVMDKNEAAVVRGPLLAKYFALLFEQIEWGGLDFLIFDLPPGTGDIQITLTQQIPLTGAIIVTTPQEISIVDVRRSVAMFKKVNVNILGIIENMSYFAPPDVPDKKYYIFGKGGGKLVAEENAVKLLGEVPLNIEMRETSDGGKPFVLLEGENPQKDVLLDIADKTVSEIRKVNYRKSLEGEVSIEA